LGQAEVDSGHHGFETSIPDMKFEIKERLADNDRVIVRGEVSGTPAVISSAGSSRKRKTVSCDGHRHSHHREREDPKDVSHGELVRGDAAIAPMKSITFLRRS